MKMIILALVILIVSLNLYASYKVVPATDAGTTGAPAMRIADIR